MGLLISSLQCNNYTVWKCVIFFCLNDDVDKAAMNPCGFKHKSGKAQLGPKIKSLAVVVLGFPKVSLIVGLRDIAEVCIYAHW